MPRLWLESWAARGRMVRDYWRERRQRGVPVLEGDPAKGTVFLLDGIGGFMLTPILARIAFRQAGLSLATYAYDWHCGPVGEMLGDLTRYRRNLLEAARVARIIRSLHRAHPQAPLHILAYSGGTGIAVFAAERLGRHARLRNLILGASALSPRYPLGTALEHVDQCHAFVSKRDVCILGLGTSVFGTVDRRFGPSAGLVGFKGQRDDRYETQPDGHCGSFTQIDWEPGMRIDGHCGHHTGCAMVDFIRNHIVPLLR